MATYCRGGRILSYWNSDRRGNGIDGVGPVGYTASRLRLRISQAGLMDYSKFSDYISDLLKNKAPYFRKATIFVSVMDGKSNKKGWGKRNYGK